MECPRCGEDNIPGLAACLACGRDLSAAPPPAGPTRPRVRAANPLRRPAARKRPGRVVVRDRSVLLFGEIMLAALRGLPPGLGAWRRGDHRAAALLAGGAVACLLGWGLLWHSALQPLAWAGFISVLASSCLTEVRARIEGPGMGHHLAGFGFSLALALCLHVVVVVAFDVAFPRVVVATTGDLPGGHFVVEQVELTDLQVDDLLAVGFLPRWWQLVPEPVQIAPVLAMPGQVVTRDGPLLLVDGQPAQAHALNPGGGMPPVPQPLTVPDGQVAVLTSPVQMVRPDRIAGRLSYRWLPQADRGPFHWPPTTPEPGSPP